MSVYVKILIIFAMLTVLSGCAKGESTNNGSSGISTHQEESIENELGLYDTSISYGENKEQHLYIGETAVVTDTAQAEQKIVKTASMSIYVKNYTDAVDNVKTIVGEAGGYIESSSSHIYAKSGSNEYRTRYITIRVPQDSYENVRTLISGLGKVENDSESAQNMTQQYYDIEARLNTKQAEEKRLIEMIEKAEKIEDLILLEERLSNVRADIEIYVSNMNNIDRISSFSTINVELIESRDEAIEPVSGDLGGRVASAFIGSINSLKTFFEYVLIFIAGAFLPIVFIAISVTVAVFIVKKRKNTINAKTKDENHE